MASEIILTLRLRAPLSLHRSRAGAQYVETLDYIPGSALRGALAEMYLAQHYQPDRVFQNLFLAGKVYYGDLWPTVEKQSTTLIPATGQACKRFGLKHSNSFHDTLLDALGLSQGSRKCPDRKENEPCEESCERVSGYFCGLSTIDEIAVRTHLRMNTAIERGLGAVAREMLFTQNTLIGKRKGGDAKGHDVFFRGQLRLTDLDLRDELERLLRVGSRLFLGAGRSRGLGEVVVVETSQEKVVDVPLAERWRRFNESAFRAGGTTDHRYFSLTLLSHLMLRDDLLRPILSNIKPQNFGLPAGAEWVHYSAGQPVCFLSMVVVSGWNAALGLPKPDTLALARGSVLLAQCDAAEEQAVVTRLAEIEAEGFGERRDEGFGHIVACYPIHYERWEVNQ